MLEKALLLTDDHSLADDRRAGRLLDFFGVPYEKQSAREFRLSESRSAGENTNYRIVCAAQTFRYVMGQLQGVSHQSSGFTRQIHSVFVYSNGDPVAVGNVVAQATGTPVSICNGAGNDSQWRIADNPEGMFGVMRDLQIRPAPGLLRSCNFFCTNGNSATPLIRVANKAAFLKLVCNNVPVFVSSERLIEIDAELASRNFDVRDHFFHAVPVVSYIRWAFPHTSWNSPDASACLIIDDPLLKARYGFVRFRELLSLMKQLGFSTSIAFIPWNWRRSDSKVVRLFKDSPGYYSLCVHGCDHTAGEFNTSDRQWLRATTVEALRRMSLHEKRTGLAHDSVMVFPQGAFSEQAIFELKRAGFDAVVNTEINSDPFLTRGLRVSDAWDVAVMAYDDFPIYSRRYPDQGIENFAFDLLLEKPCLAVIHHDFCRNGYSRLVQFINQLNALKVPLAWRCLGDVVKRSYRQREISSDLIAIEMYGSQVILENRSDRARSYLIRRREHDPQSVESLHAGSRRLSWDSNGDYIDSKVKLNPGESTPVTIRFKPAEDVPQRRQLLGHSAKIMLRRYLSEVRDNYLVPAKARIGAFSYV